MSLSIVLPPSTRVFVAAFTNAAYMQRVSITPPAGAGQPIVWQGTGEDNHPIGNQIVTTPAGSSNFTYSVSADYSTDGGSSWQQSSMIPGGCVVGSLNLKVVISEDHVDQDYYDAVVQFMWWEPLS